MKLLQAPNSPFCFKIRLVLAELGITESVALVNTDPWTDESARRANPLCKVPILLLDNGSALHSSPVICEFLDEHAGGSLIPRNGPDRWGILSAQATADGLAEAVIRRHVESLRLLDDRSRAVISRQELAISAALDVIEKRSAVARSVVCLADLAAVAAIHYLDRRSPEISWRKSHTRLAHWFDDQMRHPRTILASAAAQRQS